jgi:tetratricopeptide (TPR) repeat protein
MAEPKHLESSAASEAADRDSRAEALLVDGLDRYFSGRFDEAIHLWTRVLFLDRSHARARAYIDRARTALAERQRRIDEMLSRSSELIGGGHVEEARVLLAEAVAASGDDEYAAELRARLDRLERVRAGPARRPTVAAIEDAVPVRRPWSRSVLLASVVLAAGLALVGALGWAAIQEQFGVSAAAEALSGDQRSPLPSVLTSAEVALVRARTLYASGRLSEALRALDRVGENNTNRPAADRLRAEIQQMLLASRRGVAPENPDPSRGRP